MHKKILLFLISFCFLSSPLYSYPHFEDNPFLSYDMRKEMAPFLLPENHSTKPILDEIFGTVRVTENLDTLRQAGFEIIHVKESSHVIVVRHARLPGYLLKLYLDVDPNTRYNIPSWKWLTDRCKGAIRIKKLLKKKKCKHFVVADKWIYPLPPIATNGVYQHPILVIVTDMDIVSTSESTRIWKSSNLQKTILKELHYVLKNGAGSWFLPANIPATKSGKFAFIDTEYPKRKINVTKVKDFISPSLYATWDDICKTK